MRRQYTKALEAKPGDEWALLYLGHSYYQAGKTAKADSTFQELIQKYPARQAEVQPYITGTAGENGGQEDGEGTQTGEDPQGAEGTQPEDGTQGAEGTQPEDGTQGAEGTQPEDGTQTGDNNDIDRTGGGRLGVFN